MTWLHQIRTICKHPQQTWSGVAESSPAQRSNFWLWVSGAYFMTLFSITNIFEVAFLSLDPSLLKGPPQNPLEIKNISGDFEDHSTMYNGLRTLIDSSKLAINQTELDNLLDSIINQIKSLSDIKSSTPKPPVLSRFLKDDLEQGASVLYVRFYFFCGMPIGLFLLGTMVEHLGRAGTFKMLAKGITLFGFLMSISRNSTLLGICWFIVGFCSITIFHLVYTHMFEKYTRVYETEIDSAVAPRNDRYRKYKYRLYLGLGFTTMFNLARMNSVFVAWFTKDWTLIIMWLTLLFLIFFYVYGDFFTLQFIEYKPSDNNPDCDNETFWHALLNRPALAMNLANVSFQWFVCGLNLYVLVTGWARLSTYHNLYINVLVSSCFSLIAIPIRFGVAMVVKRKLLPYCILQIACGISILTLLGFSDAVVGNFASGKLFAGHVANVLISAVLGLLEIYTVESFPDRYRMYCVGISAAFGRIGTLTAAAITMTPYLNAVYGPAISGILAICAALISRVLPDMTASRLPRSQKDIEKEQFGMRNKANEVQMVQTIC